MYAVLSASSSLILNKIIVPPGVSSLKEDAVATKNSFQDCFFNLYITNLIC